MSMLRRACIALVLGLLAGCVGQQEPAQKLLGDIAASMHAVSADAEANVPDQYAEVQRQIAELQATFDREDYTAVIANAPAVLAAAQGLGPAVAARKAAVLAQLNGEWSHVAAVLPDEFERIEHRIDFLAAPQNRSAAMGVDLRAAQVSVRDAVALWSKGQAAYAAGNLQEAVQTAHTVQARADELAASLQPRPSARRR
jgi:hypothetical protein